MIFPKKFKQNKGEVLTTS